MKLGVAIVAVAVFAGCGVGMDDPEGFAAAGYPDMGSSSQHLTGTPAEDAEAEAPGETQTARTHEGQGVPETGQAIGVGGGGTVSAPQDPIPAFESRKNRGNPAPGF